MAGDGGEGGWWDGCLDQPGHWWAGSYGWGGVGAAWTPSAEREKKRRENLVMEVHPGGDESGKNAVAFPDRVKWFPNWGYRSSCRLLELLLPPAPSNVIHDAVRSLSWSRTPGGTWSGTWSGTRSGVAPPSPAACVCIGQRMACSFLESSSARSKHQTDRLLRCVAIAGKELGRVTKGTDMESAIALAVR